MSRQQFGNIRLCKLPFVQPTFLAQSSIRNPLEEAKIHFGIMQSCAAMKLDWAIGGDSPRCDAVQMPIHYSWFRKPWHFVLHSPSWLRQTGVQNSWQIFHTCYRFKASCSYETQIMAIIFDFLQFSSKKSEISTLQHLKYLITQWKRYRKVP